MPSLKHVLALELVSVWHNALRKWRYADRSFAVFIGGVVYLRWYKANVLDKVFSFHFRGLAFEATHALCRLSLPSRLGTILPWNWPKPTQPERQLKTPRLKETNRGHNTFGGRNKMLST
jgi:hypothetical protein